MPEAADAENDDRAFGSEVRERTLDRVIWSERGIA
jgi:hypothetical protein